MIGNGGSSSPGIVPSPPFSPHKIPGHSVAVVQLHNDNNNQQHQQQFTVMTSFGSWYDQQRAAENGEAGDAAAASGSSMFSSFGMDSEQVLPLFNSESLQGFSFESMKQSMEAQMPKKILGMGYQQRFKVSAIAEMGHENLDEEMIKYRNASS